jgi:NAD+ kinase
MKKIGFVTNLDKDPHMVYTKQLVEWVKANGCTPLVADATGECGGENTVTSDYMYRNADFVVVLGGDGTILRVARYAAIYDVPIQGINIGTLGYLADVERNDAKSAILNVIEGHYKTEERMMLEAAIERGCNGHTAHLALNEVYITNSMFSRVIKLGLEVNDDYISGYRADGIIVSTPTGSTAYNLSAGGPVLKPDTNLMAITHVCPHSLTSRPFVISGSDVVKIRVEDSYGNAVLNMDGQESIPLVNNDVVTIRKSRYVTRTIRTTNMSFYDILRNKMFESD